jgi:hypothetical protein
LIALAERSRFRQRFSFKLITTKTSPPSPQACAVFQKIGD